MSMRMAVLLLIVCGVSAIAGESVVKNGGFESGADHWTWQAGSAGATGGVLPQAGLDGASVFQISQPSEVASGEGATLIQSVSGLTKGTTYRVAAWVKGKDAGAGFWEADGQRAALPTGSFDWKQVEIVFKAGAVNRVSVGLRLTGKTDELWISRVTMVAVDDSSGDVAAQAVRLQAEYDRVQKLAASVTATATDDSVQMGLRIAARYIERLKTGGPGGTQGIRDVKPDSPEVRQWNALQVREVGVILERLEKRIAALSAGARASYQLPKFAGGRMTVDADGFWFKESATGKAIPVNPGGYGFFKQIGVDLDFLEQTGTRLVQQERGPRDLTAEGKLNDTALSIQPFLSRLAESGVFADVLLSPHYFPEWAMRTHPEVKLEGKGFLKYKIDHPVARSVVEQWINAFVPIVSASPALQSLCLSNEASYTGGGRDPSSLEKWAPYLQQRHGTIQVLNERYGTHYKDFTSVPVPAVVVPKDKAQWPAYYDWVRFNQRNFADWHRWMYDLVKAKAPAIPVHAKLVPDVFDSRPQEKRTHGGILGGGVDPELITEFTDLAGCDSWSFIAMDDEYTHTWLRTQLWYDLLNSFNQRPVIDSELHLILDRYPAESIPPEHIYNVLWQGALHHRSAFVTWIWSEPTGSSSQGSIYLRPANVFAATDAMLDLNRLAPELRAINQAPPQVAILYSMTSLFWESRYPAAVKNLYATLTFLGCKVTFISERQLEAGKLPPATILFLPQVTHASDAAAQALMALGQKGVTLIPIGEGNLAFTEYHQARPVVTLPAPLLLGRDRKEDMNGVVAALGGVAEKIPVLIDTRTGERARGADYRMVDVPGGKLVSLISVVNRDQKLQVKGLGEGIDLISGRKINLAGFTLATRESVLVKIKN